MQILLFAHIDRHAIEIGNEVLPKTATPEIFL
jgi:hypothetical protein